MNPDGASNAPDTAIVRHASALGSNPGGQAPVDPQANDGTFDWTLLFDQRRDVLTPRRNPYAELSPEVGWLKDQLASAVKQRDSASEWFEGENAAKTRRELYEGYMGEAAADHAAAGIKMQADQRNEALQAGLAAGTHMASQNPAQTDAMGNPIDMGSATGAGVAPQMGGSDPNASGGPVVSSMSLPEEQVKAEAAAQGIIDHLGQYNDEGTRRVLAEIQQHRAKRPVMAEPVRLEKPHLEQILLAVAGGAMDPKHAAQILALPFQFQLSEQERQQGLQDKKFAADTRGWEQEGQILDDQLRTAERQDTARFTAETQARRDSETRDFKREQDQKKAIVTMKRDLARQLGRIAYGPDRMRVDKATADQAAQMYAELEGFSEELMSTEDAPLLQKIDAQLKQMSVTLRASEADAQVKEATVGDRIEQSRLKTQRALVDIGIAELKAEDLAWTVDHNDAEFAMKVAKDQAYIRSVASQIQSRGIRDSLALNADERADLGLAVRSGQGELSRIRLFANNARKTLAEAEKELNGTAVSPGLNERIQNLKEFQRTGKGPNGEKWTAEQAALLKQMEARQAELGTVIQTQKTTIEKAGKAYNDTAEIVKTLGDTATVKALGGKDDRKVDIGGAVYDMSGSYKFGSASADVKDCSAFVQTAMKAKGVKTFPRTCSEQLKWMTTSGKANGFTDVTKAVATGQMEPQKGDIFYLPGTPPPKGSGYHVKVFLGADKNGTPVFMEAKGSRSGVGTFTDTLKGKRLFGIWRPPQ